MVGHNAHNKQPFQLEVWCLAGAVCLKSLPWDVFNRMQQPVVKVSARSWNDLLSWLKHVPLPTSKAPSKYYTHVSLCNASNPSFLYYVHYHPPPPSNVDFLFCTENPTPPPPPKKKAAATTSTQNKEQQQANHYPYIIYVCVVCINVANQSQGIRGCVRGRWW